LLWIVEEDDMRIGDLSRRTGIAIETLRWYDRIGLVKAARRDPISRFREYGGEAVEALRLVRWAKLAGLGLAEARRIVRAAEGGAPCATVVPLLEGKLREIAEAIRGLQALRRRLRRALKARRTRRGPCGILRAAAGSRRD
jgi:DNA-binding transcriptional MerR regulator